MIGVLHRGGERRHHQQLSASGEEEIDHIETRSGAEVEQQVIGRQRGKLAQELELLGMGKVGHVE